jgi:hypothetical protein
MHREVNEQHEKQRERGRKQQSVKRAPLPNFAVGDYVLKARVRKRGATHKLAATWGGPYRVVAIGTGHVFEVQQLLSGEVSSAHVSRLTYYADSSLNVTTELKDHIQLVEQQGLFEMERLVAVRENEDELEAHVAWAGFEEAEWTWEPLSQLLEDRKQFVVKQLQLLKLSKKLRSKIASEFAVIV